MTGSCRQTTPRLAPVASRRAHQIDLPNPTIRGNPRVTHGTMGLKPSRPCPAPSFELPSQTRKTRSKSIIRKHKFLIGAYKNSPDIRQLRAFTECSRAPFAVRLRAAISVTLIDAIDDYPTKRPTVLPEPSGLRKPGEPIQP